MSKRILIATGGTGGHLYPALALAEQLKEDLPDCQIEFAGGGFAKNQSFNHSSFPYRQVSCGSLGNLSPWTLLKNGWKICQGVRESRSLIRQIRPSVVVGFGSFYSFPPLLAAKSLSIPIILHEANSIPGKVNRLLSRYVAAVGVHFPQARTLLKGNIVEVSMPLRKGFRCLHTKRAEAREYFGLRGDCPVLLIFGGSQGAHSINTFAQEAACRFGSIQVLHFTGHLETAKDLQAAYDRHLVKAVVKTFENRMELAWQSADIVIARAGAGTISEQLEFEVPGILIPYPQASDNHQEHNANFMVDTVGGGIKLLDKELNSQSLHEHLSSLVCEEGLCQKMQQAMHDYKKRICRRDFCSLVKEFI